MVANGAGDEGGGEGMDAKVARWVGDALKWATVLVGVVVYVERSKSHLELVDALNEERSKARDMRSADHESRIGRLEQSDADRLGVGIDGGFSHPGVRGLLNGTIRKETEHLATKNELGAEALRLRGDLRAANLADIGALKAELRSLIERIATLNNLKTPQ